MSKTAVRVKAPPLSKWTTVQEVVDRFDHGWEVLFEYFGPCFTCANFMRESLAALAEEHQVEVTRVLDALKRPKVPTIRRKSR